MHRRIEDHLKREARRDLEDAVARHVVGGGEGPGRAAGEVDEPWLEPPRPVLAHDEYLDDLLDILVGMFTA